MAKELVNVKVTTTHHMENCDVKKLKSKYCLHWDREEKGFVGTIANGWKKRSLQKFCKKKKIKFSINNKFGKRSKTYREDFFAHYPPLFKDVYLCAYCGRPVNKKKITVDHIYPVMRANTSLSLQKKLKSLGATSVNSYQNLAPACRACNLKKGTKEGLWIVRGFYGRNKNIRLGLDIFILCVFIGIFGYAITQSLIFLL